MLENFINRCLYKSIDFISKLEIKFENINLNQSFLLYNAITHFNLKEYQKVYNSLLCKESIQYINNFVFCDCCSSTFNFLRNYALFINSPNSLEPIHKPTIDPFLLYLRALFTQKKKKKIKFLIQCLNTNEYFWEAYEHLADQIQHSNIIEIENGLHISDQLKSIFFIYVFGQRMCKTDKFYLYFDNLLKNRLGIIGYDMITGQWGDYKKYDMSVLNQSEFIAVLTASTLYHIKQFERSKFIYKKLTENKFYYNLDFIDLYSNILYIKGDTITLAQLATSSSSINRFRPETHAIIANYYSLRRDHKRAIEYFEKAITLDKRFTTLNTLIGHEYIDQKDVNGAIKAYNNSIRYNPSDYRAWFGMAQVYNTLKLHEYSLFYYNQALDLNNQDGFIWSAMGQLLGKLKKKEDSLKCYRRAIELGDIEGYLLIADLYKNEKKYVTSVKYYEKYVDEIISDNKTIPESNLKIFTFLSEYFDKIGNKRKANYYSQLSVDYEIDKI